MNYLKKRLERYNYSSIITENYIIAEGTLPICLIAHCDTVFKTLPKEWIYDSEKEVLWSPGGAGFDDRAGIAAILEILREGYRPSVIFTTGEEKGGIGAFQLTVDFPKRPFYKKPKMMIELDRQGTDDCVFYECNNRAFVKMIESYGFKEQLGSFTDISFLAPQWGVAATNLSVGYYDEHTSSERIYIKQLKSTIEKVINIIKDIESLPEYEYIKAKNFNLYTPEMWLKDNLKEDQVCYFCGKRIGEKACLYHFKDRSIFNRSTALLCPDCFSACI